MATKTVEARPTVGTLASELEQLGFTATEDNRLYFKGPGLYARIYPPSKDAPLTLGLAERKTFDRWANSLNFIVRIVPDSTAPDIALAIKEARRICRSGVFDFNTYFHAINLS